MRSDSHHDVKTERGGEDKRRVVRQHRKIEAQGECRHVARGIFSESFVEEVECAGEEGEQQRVLPDLGCDLNDRWQEGDEEKSD